MNPKRAPRFAPRNTLRLSCFFGRGANGFPHSRGLVWPRSLTLSPRLDGSVITLASKAQARAIMAAPRSQTGRVPVSASNGSKLSELRMKTLKGSGQTGASAPGFGTFFRAGPGPGRAPFLGSNPGAPVGFKSGRPLWIQIWGPGTGPARSRAGCPFLGSNPGVPFGIQSGAPGPGPAARGWGPRPGAARVRGPGPGGNIGLVT